MVMRREVNLNLRNIKQATWTKLCFMYRLRRKNTTKTSLKDYWLKYADHYLKKIIQDKELKDNILTENSAPKNFMKVPSLDVFIQDTMKEEGWNYELTMDSVLEKMQGKTRDLFDPLSRVCTYLQEVTWRWRWVNPGWFRAFIKSRWENSCHLSSSLEHHDLP